MQEYTIGSIVAVSVVLHALLIAYGEHHDAVVAFQSDGDGLKYTDIDYHVFSDAAEHVVRGGSPFDRKTYRYTPFVAWILYPGAAYDVHVWGKIVFSAFDVAVGWLTYEIVGLQLGSGGRPQSGNKSRVLAAAVWLLNPMALVVSTRGNAESLMALLVLATLLFAMKRKAVLAGVAFGLAVHFKIYPIVYAAPLYFSFGSSETSPSKTLLNHLLELLWPNAARIRFVLAFVASFLVPTIGFYRIYGQQYLDEAFLYHLSRSDVKHNFSPYFYPMYLLADRDSAAQLSLVAFVPQAAAVVTIALRYSGHRHLPFCMFLQTLAFVTLNKVCTSQYFLWYLCLLPTVLVRLSVPTPPVRLMAVVAAWVSSQAAWLLAAYLLEFRGMQTIVYVWLASLLFLLSNAFAMDFFVRSYIW